MYTHGPGSNIVPRSASAITAIALGMPSAVRRVPSSGSTAMSTCGGRAVADLLAVVEHRRLVLLALADHDDAVHRDRVEHVAHRVDGGLVGGLLVAAPDHPRRGQSSGLGHAHELEREVAVGPPSTRRRAHGTTRGVRERQVEATRMSRPPVNPVNHIQEWAMTEARPTGSVGRQTVHPGIAPDSSALRTARFVWS